nr:cyclic AMP-dependent transcription factor ATF-3-like [Dasypus novemcinctus]
MWRRGTKPLKTMKGKRCDGKGIRLQQPSAEIRRRRSACKKESEKLESVNAELKAQIEELKNEKQHLIYMLNLHRPTCIVRAQNGRTPEDERNLFIQQMKEGALQS